MPDNHISGFGAILNLVGLLKSNVKSAIQLHALLRAYSEITLIKRSMSDLAMMRSNQLTIITVESIEKLKNRDLYEYYETICHDFTKLRISTETAEKSFKLISKFLNYSNPSLAIEVEQALKKRVDLISEALDNQDSLIQLQSAEILQIYEDYQNLSIQMNGLLQALSEEISIREKKHLVGV